MKLPCSSSLVYLMHILLSPLRRTLHQQPPHKNRPPAADCAGAGHDAAAQPSVSTDPMKGERGVAFASAPAESASNSVNQVSVQSQGRDQASGLLSASRNPSRYAAAVHPSSGIETYTGPPDVTLGADSVPSLDGKATSPALLHPLGMGHCYHQNRLQPRQIPWA